MSSPRWQYLEVSWTQRWREAESPVQGFVFVFVFVFIIYIDTQECTQSFSSFPTHHLVFCPFVLPYFHNCSPYKVRAKVSSSTVRRSHSVDTILEQKSEQDSRCINSLVKAWITFLRSQSGYLSPGPHSGYLSPGPQSGYLSPGPRESTTSNFLQSLKSDLVNNDSEERSN